MRKEKTRNNNTRMRNDKKGKEKSYSGNAKKQAD